MHESAKTSNALFLGWRLAIEINSTNLIGRLIVSNDELTNSLHPQRFVRYKRKYAKNSKTLHSTHTGQIFN